MFFDNIAERKTTRYQKSERRALSNHESKMNIVTISQVIHVISRIEFRRKGLQERCKFSFIGTNIETNCEN